MVAVESIVNEATTYLTGAIASGATSITVLSAADFPPPPFRIRLSGALTAGGNGIEFARVTAVAGTTWTITRATETPWNTALGFASGAKVEQVVTAAGLAEVSGMVNVKRFGIKGDGTDEGAAINNALAYVGGLGDYTAPAWAVTGTGGGTLFFPPGTYMTSVGLDVPPGVKIKGSGINATILKRTAGNSNPLLKLYGQETWVRHWYASVEDVTLHGNDQSGTIMDCVYASQLRVTNVLFFGAPARALDLVCCWDSNIRGCFFEWVGGVNVAGVPAIHVRNSRAASGFGWSDDNSNEIRFTDCHLEQFRAGGFRIEASQGTNEPNGIYITNLKMENQYISGSQPFILVTSEANRVHIRNVYAYAGGLLDGGAVNIIETSSVKQCTFRDIFVGNGAAPATVLSAILVNVPSTSNGLTVIDSVYGQYTVAPTNGHVNVTSHASLQVANLRTSTGTLLNGYEIDSALRKRSLTSAITNTSTTAANISQLTFSNVQPGSYQLEMDGMDQSSVATAGARFGVGGTATISTIGGFITQQTSATAGTTTEITAANTTFGTNPAGTGALRVSMSVGVTVTAVGTVGIRWNQSAASTGTLRIGTNVTLTRVQ